mgnify:CR=1 FL=1|jgi:hypothetical protein
MSKESKRMIEVWKWKESAFKDVEKYHPKDRVRKRIEEIKKKRKINRAA